MGADYTVVSHEQDGRILSGVGDDVDADTLADALDRHTPEDKRVEPEQPKPAEAEGTSEQPKQSRGQKRFADLTREREDAKRRADAAEKRAAELEARFSQQTQAQATPVTHAPLEKGAAATLPGGAGETGQQSKPLESDIGDKYKSYEEFVDALTDWKLEQRLKKEDIDARIRTSIEADRASRSFAEHIEKTRARGREAYQDFDAILASGPGAHVPMNRDRLEAIGQHPASEHLQYVIAKDAALAQRLASCHPFEFGSELARLTPTAPVASPASTAAPALATAPTPYQPVGSGSKTSTTSSADIAKTGDYEAYRARRAVEREQRSRR